MYVTSESLFYIMHSIFPRHIASLFFHTFHQAVHVFPWKTIGYGNGKDERDSQNSAKGLDIDVYGMKCRIVQMLCEDFIGWSDVRKDIRSGSVIVRDVRV